MPINETSEQNSNGYCNVDFVFTLDQTDVSFICCIKVIFSIMNLYLFLKCMPSDLKSLAHCGLTCVVSVIFCAMTCTVIEVAICIVNASHKELQVFVWLKFIRH
jgi:type III secretory pathway component EscU